LQICTPSASLRDIINRSSPADTANLIIAMNIPDLVRDSPCHIIGHAGMRWRTTWTSRFTKKRTRTPVNHVASRSNIAVTKHFSEDYEDTIGRVILALGPQTLESIRLPRLEMPENEHGIALLHISQGFLDCAAFHATTGHALKLITEPEENDLVLACCD
jgi:hypothetical protein